MTMIVMMMMMMVTIFHMIHTQIEPTLMQSKQAWLK